MSAVTENSHFSGANLRWQRDINLHELFDHRASRSNLKLALSVGGNHDAIGLGPKSMEDETLHNCDQTCGIIGQTYE